MNFEQQIDFLSEKSNRIEERLTRKRDLHAVAHPGLDDKSRPPNDDEISRLWSLEHRFAEVRALVEQLEALSDQLTAKKEQIEAALAHIALELDECDVH